MSELMKALEKNNMNKKKYVTGVVLLLLEFQYFS